MIVGLYIAAIVVAYLLGSIPCGLIIARMTTRTDVRTIGSGKTGTTNVMRAAGSKAAAAALLLDLGKAALAVGLADIIMGNNEPYLAQALAGMAAITGHNWSIFLGFKGGRGVATFIGGMSAMYWPAALIGGIFIVGIGIRSRYMSLGSIIGSLVAFIYMMPMTVLQVDFLKPSPPIHYVVYALVGTIFIYIMHRDNILRLLNGTERKIGEKSPSGPEPSATSSK